MALTTQIKTYANRILKHANLRVDTLTKERVENERLLKLDRTGHFDRAVLPVPHSFKSMNLEEIIRDLGIDNLQVQHLRKPGANDLGYTYENGYFTSPDAEVLYAMICKFSPQRVVEVGCGNSTKITKQAILDRKLNTRLYSIDPQPRVEVSGIPDEIFLEPVESLKSTDLFDSLEENDILFIDSSHAIKTGNDVVFLLTTVLPSLRPGVLVHIHDIFIPFDYPREWVLEERWDWNEQYLVYVLVAFSSLFEVVWAGHYLQRTSHEFPEYFPDMGGGTAKSLWLRKIN